MSAEPRYAAFAGARRLATGTLREVLPALRARHERDRNETLLVFEVESGRRVHLELRGSAAEVGEAAAPPPRRKPGRPRLGVTSREITLLPRHWKWLEGHPSGVSATLRRLVEQAIQVQPGPTRARLARAALEPFLSAMAGDRPHHEEACRALHAGDTARFAALIASWPKDVREYAIERAREADRLEQGG